jgi:membrane protein YqaA with SNARE-associated domain
MERLSLVALFFSAILDTAAVGVPTGPLVAVASYAAPHKAAMFVAVGAVGSAVGALVPFAAGRLASGWALRRWPRAVEFEHRFARHRFATVLLASALPVPTKPFLAAAGLFHVPVLLVFPATVCGRALRYGVESLLVLKFGPPLLALFTALHWSLIVAMLLTLVLAAWAMGWNPFRRWARS